MPLKHYAGPLLGGESASTSGPPQASPARRTAPDAGLIPSPDASDDDRQERYRLDLSVVWTGQQVLLSLSDDLGRIAHQGGPADLVASLLADVWTSYHALRVPTTPIELAKALAQALGEGASLDDPHIQLLVDRAKAL